MKYLKTFEDQKRDDIIKDCNDILVDLFDDGVPFRFSYVNEPNIYKTIHKYIPRSNDSIQLIVGGNNSFDPGKYIDSLEHLNSYLNSKGYNYDSNGSHYKTWKEKIESIERFKGTPSGKLTWMAIHWGKE